MKENPGPLKISSVLSCLTFSNANFLSQFLLLACFNTLLVLIGSFHEAVLNSEIGINSTSV